MAYNPNNPNGQATMANSEPVVIASDQTTIPISATTLPLPTLAATSTKQSDGSQKTQIVDASGNVIDSISGGGFDNLLIGMGATNYIVSTVNSTSAQLTSGSTFTGTVETVFNQQSYSILVVSDRNGTLTLRQYIDLGGTQLISLITFEIIANVPFARSGVLNGNYFNLTFKNDSASTTSTLKIDTAYGTIPSATQLNNAPVAIMEIGGVSVTPLFRGRTGTFRTLGRAGTTGQKIMAIHNATGSTVKIKISKIIVDMWSTVVKAVTVVPPIIRAWKFTAVPTNGTQLTKNKIGGSTTSSSSVTVWGDASADGTGSATTLTVTLPAGTILTQKAAPRIITAVGEVGSTSIEFMFNSGIELGALEGVCLFLDYTVATQNPVTDMWIAAMEWEEFNL